MKQKVTVLGFDHGPPGAFDACRRLLAACVGASGGRHCGELIAKADAELDRLEADARALWAVRVLDAHGDYRVTTSEPVLVRVFRGGEKTLRFRGADEDAARLAAAHAVFPSLDETTRAKLGECP